MLTLTANTYTTATLVTEIQNTIDACYTAAPSVNNAAAEWSASGTNYTWTSSGNMNFTFSSGTHSIAFTAFDVNNGSAPFTQTNPDSSTYVFTYDGYEFTSSTAGFSWKPPDNFYIMGIYPGYITGWAGSWYIGNSVWLNLAATANPLLYQDGSDSIEIVSMATGTASIKVNIAANSITDVTYIWHVAHARFEDPSNSSNFLEPPNTFAFTAASLFTVSESSGTISIAPTQSSALFNIFTDNQVRNSEVYVFNNVGQRVTVNKQNLQSANGLLTNNKDVPAPYRPNSIFSSPVELTHLKAIYISTNIPSETQSSGGRTNILKRINKTQRYGYI